MIFKSKVIRITSYVFLGLILILFLAFLLTYNFTPKSKYRPDVSGDYSETFLKLVRSSLEESKDINMVTVDLKKDTINEIIIQSFDPEEDYIYETEYWGIKGITSSIVNHYLVLNVHMLYKRNIHYPVKLSAYFELKETSDAYIFKLSKTNLGALLFPSYLTKSIIKNLDEGSIGSIISGALMSLKFGSVDPSDLSISISKKELFESFDDGILGDTLIGYFPKYRKALSAFLTILSKNELIKINIDKKLYFSLDYSKLLSSEATVDNMITTLDESKGKYYDEALSYLVNSTNIPVSSSFLTAILNLKIGNITSSSSIMYESKLLSMGLKKNLDTYTISLIYLFNSKYINVEVEFKNISDTLILNKVYIGRDENENKELYLMEDDSIVFDFIKEILSGYSIKLTDDYRISLKELLSELKIPYTLIDNNSIIVKDNEYVDEIKDALTSNEFRELVEGEVEVDFSTISTILNSFNYLDVSKKEYFLTKLKEYLKEIDINVYNYISVVV